MHFSEFNRLAKPTFIYCTIIEQSPVSIGRFCSLFRHIIQYIKMFVRDRRFVDFRNTWQPQSIFLISDPIEPYTS